jgi:hypothetical protein
MIATAIRRQDCPTSPDMRYAESLADLAVQLASGGPQP